MNILTDNEIASLADHSKLTVKYNPVIASQRAFDMLTAGNTIVRASGVL
jgi:hypothetical protein